MKIIWATRGRTWGFQFRRRAGLSDPLAVYGAAFVGLENERKACRRHGDTVALRFEDPLKRRDSAGRIIPHDFVVYQPLAKQVTSVEDGLRVVWPLVADEFARDWELPKPPIVTD
jgi:hypothetical protein